MKNGFFRYGQIGSISPYFVIPYQMKNHIYNILHWLSLYSLFVTIKDRPVLDWEVWSKLTYLILQNYYVNFPFFICLWIFHIVVDEGSERTFYSFCSLLWMLSNKEIDCEIFASEPIERIPYLHLKKDII